MDRHQLALECQEVERLGGSVRDFLRGRGAVSPWGTWYRLQIEELGRKNAQITEGVEKEMAWKQILTKEARAEVERMIEAGEDPKPFLEKAGSKNPSAHEFMIRRQMEKKKAEGTPKPPKDKPQPRPQSEVRTVPAEDGVPPVVRTVAPLPDLEKQQNMEIPEVEVVMNEDGIQARRRKNTVTKTQILAVRSTKTDIRYEINTDGTEISMMFGLDEVVMNVERMKEFAEELPGIMSQLGVEV